MALSIEPTGPSGEPSSFEARIIKAICDLVDAEERRDDSAMAHHLLLAVRAVKEMRTHRKNHPEFSDGELVRIVGSDGAIAYGRSYSHYRDAATEDDEVTP